SFRALRSVGRLGRRLLRGCGRSICCIVRRGRIISLFKLFIGLMWGVTRRSCGFAFAVAHKIEPQTGEGEGSQQTKGVHVSKERHISSDKQQDDDRNSRSEQDGIVRGPAQGILPLEKRWKALHP